MGKLALLLFLFAHLASEAQVAYSKELSFPKRKNSIETLSPFVKNIAVNKDHILIIPKREKFVIWTPYHGPQKTREKTFGKRIDSKRAPITVKTYTSFRAYGATPYADHFILFDSDQSGLLRMFNKKNFGIFRTFSIDLLRPPRDRGGEGTSREIEAFRKQFSRNVFDTNKEPYSGITPIPKTWYKTHNDLYFLSTRIKDFPLLMLECKKEEPTQCLLIRGCTLQGRKMNPPGGFSGIAAHPTKKILLFADEKNRTIIQYRYNSCSSGRYERSLTLHKKIKGLSSITIDARGDLWVGAPFKDDYDNASVYRWSEKDWMSP